MKTVSKEVFYAFMNPRDVTPKVDTATLRSRWHVSYWEDRYRLRLGLTRTDSWGIEATIYELSGDRS